MDWLVFGFGALLVAFVVAANAAKRPSWVVWQLFAGIGLAVLVWKIGDASGAFADEDPEACSDCGGAELWSLVALLCNIIGWAVGTAAGGVYRFVVRRAR